MGQLLSHAYLIELMIESLSILVESIDPITIVSDDLGKHKLVKFLSHFIFMN